MNHRSSRPIATILAAVAVLAALRVALSDSWSTANADDIRVAALEAVLSHPDGPRNHPELVVYVEIDTGQELLRSPGRSEDPSPALLRSIQRLRSMVCPQSECERTRDGVRHRPSGAAAVIIGVAAPRRATDDRALRSCAKASGRTTKLPGALCASRTAQEPRSDPRCWTDLIGA
jgi:hypothetical protein